MLSAMYSRIMDMTIVAGYVILVVLSVRVLLKKAPKCFLHLLWMAVLLRLLCPVSIQTPISLVPQGIRLAEIAVSPGEEKELSEDSLTKVLQESSDKSKDWIHAGKYMWLIGMLGMACYYGRQYVNLRRKLLGAARLNNNIYVADHISVPFVMGILRPKIYLPSWISRSEQRWIVAHEQKHIQRLDHVTCLLFATACCIHWFNPLVWLGTHYFKKDMEMSCDEAVVRERGSQIRAEYCASLLNLAMCSSPIKNIPLAFFGDNTKERILNMAKWKQYKKHTMVILALFCMAIVFMCAVDPQISKAESLVVPDKKVLLEQGCYPLNEHGETYGPDLWEWQETPDLILAENKDGLLGYVRRSEVTPEYPIDSEEWANYLALEWYDVNMYLHDGVTVIGTFTVGERP